MPNVIVWAVSIPQGSVPCASEGRIFMPLWKDPKGNWRYQFQHLGQRHSKTGFKPKAEARSAQEDH
jgi:hypothetical protein